MSQFRFFEKWVWILCLPDTTFPRDSEADSREKLAGASPWAGPLSSTRFSVNSLNHSGRSRNGFHRTVSLSPILFVFSVSAGSCDGLLRTVQLVLSLLVDAGCCAGITASCGKDVGDAGVAELEELVDKRSVRSSPCCILFVCRFDRVVVSDHWSTRRNIHNLPRTFRGRERPVYLPEALLSQISPILWNGRFICLHFAVGCDNRRRTDSQRPLRLPNSAAFRSFLLNMCIDALESTTNTLSSGFITDGAGSHHSLVGEKKVALSFSLSF